MPVRERSFFRMATMTDSIQNGHVVKPYFVFFPHTADGPLFADEESLARSVPMFFKTWLEPARERLSSRAAIVRAKRRDWWGLMHSRSWAVHNNPRIITKFFSAEGGFVDDLEAAYLPVMGHVWTPGDLLVEADEDSLPIGEILAAYVALLNSAPFARLLSLYAPHVAGGQFDLSARHVNPMPLPDLRALSTNPRAGRQISELGHLGRNVDVTDQNWRARSSQIVTELYGTPGLAFL